MERFRQRLIKKDYAGLDWALAPLGLTALTPAHLPRSESLHHIPVRVPIATDRTDSTSVVPMGMNHLLFSQSTLDKQIICVLSENLVDDALLHQVSDEVVGRCRMHLIGKVVVFESFLPIGVVDLRVLEEVLLVEESFWVGELDPS